MILKDYKRNRNTINAKSVTPIKVSIQALLMLLTVSHAIAMLRGMMTAQVNADISTITFDVCHSSNESFFM